MAAGGSGKHGIRGYDEAAAGVPAPVEAEHEPDTLRAIRVSDQYSAGPDGVSDLRPPRSGGRGMSGSSPDGGTAVGLPRALRCLVVDDDPSLRLVVSETLGDIGHVAIEAADPDAALALLRRDRFDVMLTDIRLPFMDGIELATRARQIDPDLRIVFATAYNDLKLPRNALTPFTRYLRKPFGQSELEATFASLGFAAPPDAAR